MAGLIRASQGSTEGTPGRVFNAVVGQPVVLTDVNATPGAKLWEIGDLSSGSSTAIERGTASLTTPTANSASFTPDAGLAGSSVRIDLTAGGAKVSLVIRIPNDRGWAKDVFNGEPDPAYDEGDGRGWATNQDRVLDDLKAAADTADAASTAADAAQAAVDALRAELVALGVIP